MLIFFFFLLKSFHRKYLEENQTTVGQFLIQVLIGELWNRDVLTLDAVHALQNILT